MYFLQLCFQEAKNDKKSSTFFFSIEGKKLERKLASILP